MVHSQVYRCASCYPLHDMCTQCFQNSNMNYSYRECVFFTNSSKSSLQWTPAVAYRSGTKDIGSIQGYDLQYVDNDILLTSDDSLHPPMHRYLAKSLSTTTFKIAKDRGQVLCAICSNSFFEGSTIKVLPCSLRHVVHLACLLSLLTKEQKDLRDPVCATCPKCSVKDWLFPSLMNQTKTYSSSSTKAELTEKTHACSRSLSCKFKSMSLHESNVEFKELVVKGTATGKK